MSEIDPDRAVIICPHCSLNQFATVSGNCRKCRKALNAPKLEKPAVAAKIDASLFLYSTKPKAAVPTTKSTPKHDRLVRKARAGALAEFKAAKSHAERRAVIAWYLSNKNAPYIRSAV